jgi:hypothetical protein
MEVNPVTIPQPERRPTGDALETTVSKPTVFVVSMAMRSLASGTISATAASISAGLRIITRPPGLS